MYVDIAKQKQSPIETFGTIAEAELRFNELLVAPYDRAVRVYMMADWKTEDGDRCTLRHAYINKGSQSEESSDEEESDNGPRFVLCWRRVEWSVASTF